MLPAHSASRLHNDYAVPVGLKIYQFVAMDQRVKIYAIE